MKRFHFKIYTGPDIVREVGGRLAQQAQGGWWHDVSGTAHVYVIIECMTADAARLDVKQWLTLAGFPPSSGLRAVLYKESAIPTAKCRWFARCDRDATTTTHHPILGDVPTCDRCHKFATT